MQDAKGRRKPAGRGVETGDGGACRPQRAAIKILQCNNELCQYELRQDGDIESVSQSKRVVKLKLEQAPKLCLIIKKPNAPQLHQPLRDVASFMHDDLQLNVAVEPTVKAEFPDLPFLVSVGPPPQPFSDFLGTPAIASPCRYDAETLKAVDFVGMFLRLLSLSSVPILWCNGGLRMVSSCISPPAAPREAAALHSQSLVACEPTQADSCAVRCGSVPRWGRHHPVGFWAIQRALSAHHLLCHGLPGVPDAI